MTVPVSDGGHEVSVRMVRIAGVYVRVCGERGELGQAAEGSLRQQRLCPGAPTRHLDQQTHLRLVHVQHA